MKTSLSKPTRYEQARIDALRRYGCVACAHLGLPNVNQLELNHLLEGGVRMGHWFTIFLCRGHHQGDWSSDQLELIAPHQRVSIADGRKAFTKEYPSERALWERVQARLHLPAVWPSSKIVPRRAYVEADPSLALPAPAEEAARALPDRGLEGDRAARVGPEAAANGSREGR